MKNKKELPPCPVEVTLSMISDRWKVLIIRDLITGTKRFGELRKSIGKVSQKVLTTNLRGMEEDGLVTRKVLTETGRSLKPILDAMDKWGSEYKIKCK